VAQNRPKASSTSLQRNFKTLSKGIFYMSEIQPNRARPLLDQIFFSPDEPRLRAGWRLALHSLLLILLGACLSVPLFITLFFFDPALLASYPNIQPVYLLLAIVVETIVVTASVFLARRYLDKRSIESLGLKLNLQSLFDFLVGIAITLLQMGLIYVLMTQLGWITFEGFAWEVDPVGIVIKNTLLFFLTFILVGWTEELLSRGYHLQTIASGTNLLWGVILSSAVFSFLHLGNAGANWASVTGIFFAGIFFAYAYVCTKQLWLPIGMHIGWNFFEGVVFGFPVSGLNIYPLTRITVQGPEIWTGGVFGPEAGLMVLPALLLGSFLIYLYTVRRTI
jgi:membrane protease YdiL (CAAX protease family)